MNEAVAPAPPDVMHDGKNWWTPCPARGHPYHQSKAWRLANLPGHAPDPDGIRC